MARAHKEVGGTPKDKVYAVQPYMPDLFEGQMGGRSVEDELRGKARSLNRGDRFDILFKELHKDFNLKGRVEKILKAVKGDKEGADEAFRVVLDTVAFARRRDPNALILTAAGTIARDSTKPRILEETVGFVELCIDKGSLPVGRMKDLLAIGFTFNSLSNKLIPENIEKQKRWLKAEDIKIHYPDVSYIVHLLSGPPHSMTAVFSEGRKVALDEAKPKVLLGVYAGIKRAEEAAKRRHERGLDARDW
jgi:hypothetical protein